MVGSIAQRVGPRVRSLGEQLWQAYAPILALMAIYYGTASLVLGQYEAEIPVKLVQAIFNIKFMLIALVLAGAVSAYLSLVQRTGERALVRLKKWLARQPYSEVVLLRFLPVVLLMIPFQKTYTAVKIHIPEIVPFSWDETFIHLDRVLFLGVDPWTLTHWLFPWPLATWIVNIAYILWFYLLMGCLAAAAVMPLDSRVRLTYLLACFLSWSFGGSLLAVMFSSAGPVYYERLFGDPLFSPLFERLAAQHEIYPLISVITQEQLWQAYADPAIPPIGISAFPSMHLCIAAGMVLFAFRLSRPVGWLLAAFTTVMLIGSVHLGWHYAVDGIAGIGLAFACWRVAERFSSWWFARSAVTVSATTEPAGRGVGRPAA